MRVLVTGGAGFIGSHVVDRLLEDGHEVTVYDNFSSGHREFLPASPRASLTIVAGDCLDTETMTRAMRGHDTVFHLAANADVRSGLQQPRRDLEQNTIATFNVLEAMRTTGAARLAFSSTGCIYGEPAVFPTPETCPFPIQTSLYGASKLAGEGLIAAYAEGFGIQAHVFRFVSILGERYTHGHVYDFYTKLLADPARLEILGDGRQRKSYLYVGDCVEAMMTALAHAREQVNIFNLGTDEHCAVDDSVEWITGHLGCTPTRTHTGGPRGWIGDSPFIFLDCSRIRALGWQPKLTIREAILRTLEYLQANRWVLATPSGR